MLTTVTALISRGGREQAIADAFARALARERSHHLSSLLIQQNGGVAFLVSHFANQAELDAWRATQSHADMIAAFEHDGLRELCTISEPVVRIAVPSDGSGPKWKIFASTWVIIYPLLLVLSYSLNAAAPALPLAARLALTSSMLSVASIWIISPIANALTRTWRLRSERMAVEPARAAG